METPTNAAHRTRLLRFGDAEAAAAARRCLDDLPSLACAESGRRALRASWDVTQLSMALIDARLARARISRRRNRIAEVLDRWCEAVQRDLAGTVPGWSAAVRSAYLAHYRATRHGRRDDRPQQWRAYVRPPRRPRGPA